LLSCIDTPPGHLVKGFDKLIATTFSYMPLKGLVYFLHITLEQLTLRIIKTLGAIEDIRISPTFVANPVDAQLVPSSL
jgi:hypothetical protein